MKKESIPEQTLAQLDRILKHASAPELQTLLKVLKEDHTVRIIAQELQKSGITNNDIITKTLTALIDDLKFKFAQSSERGEKFRLIEWLEYWFGEGTGESKLRHVGVFFQESNNFMDHLEQYVANYRTTRVEAPEGRLEYISKRVEDLNSAVESGNREAVQNFVDEFAAQYVLDENGNFKTGPDDKIMVRDKYNVKNELYSKKNKELIDQYNQGILGDREQLIAELHKTVQDHLENLHDFIDSNRPVELPREVLSVSKTKGEEGAKDTFIGLRHLIIELEYICDATLKQVSGEDKKPEQLKEQNQKSKEALKQLKEQNSILEKESADINNQLRELQQYLDQNELILTQQGEENNPQLKQTVDETRLMISDLQNNLKEKRRDVLVARNQNAIKDHEHKIERTNAELKMHLDFTSSYTIHSNKLKKYKNTLKEAEEDLKRYKLIDDILKTKDLLITDEDKFGRYLAQINNLLNPRDKLVKIDKDDEKYFKEKTKEKLIPLSEKEDKTTMIFDKESPEWKLLPESDIAQMRDEFVEGLQTYSEQQQETITAHKEVSDLLQGSLDKLTNVYDNIRRELFINLKKLTNKGSYVPEIAESAEGVTNALTRFDKRKENMQTFREALSAYNGYDTDEIKQLIDPAGDNVTKSVRNSVAISISSLYKFISRLERDQERLTRLENYDLNREDIINTIEELKRLGEYSEDNPYGLQKATSLLRKLQSIPDEEKGQLAPTGSSASFLNDVIIKPLESTISSIKSKASETSLNTITDGINSFVGGINNIIEREFVDIHKIEKLLEDARKAESLKPLFSDDHMIAFIRTISVNSQENDTTIEELTRNDVIRNIEELKKALLGATDTLESKRNEIIQSVFGKYGNGHAMVLRKREINQSLTAIDSNIKECRETLADKNLSEDEKSWNEERLQKQLKVQNIKSTELEEIQNEIKDVKEYQGNALEISLIVEKVLFPQKGEILKVFNDRRKDFDFEEGRTVMDLAEGVTTTKEVKKSPSAVSLYDRNWYSHVRTWKDLVDQCARSISNAVDSKTNTYASRIHELSPAQAALAITPLQGELDSILKEMKIEKNPKILKYLQDRNQQIVEIQGKIAKKPMQVVTEQLERLLQLKKETDDDKKLLSYIRYLVDLQNKLDRNPGLVTQKDYSNIEKMRFSKTEHQLIDELKDKWEGAGAGISAEEYASMLEDTLPSLYEEKEQIEEKGIDRKTDTKTREKYIELTKNIQQIEMKVAQAMNQKQHKIDISDEQFQEYNDIITGRLSKIDYDKKGIESELAVGNNISLNSQKHMALQRERAGLWKYLFKLKYHPEGLDVDDIQFLVKAIAQRNTESSKAYFSRTQKEKEEEYKHLEKATTPKQKIPEHQKHKQEKQIDPLMNIVKPYFIDRIELLENHLNGKIKLTDDKAQFLQDRFDQIEQILSTDLQNMGTAFKLQEDRIQEINKLYSEITKEFEGINELINTIKPQLIKVLESIETILAETEELSDKEELTIKAYADKAEEILTVLKDEGTASQISPDTAEKIISWNNKVNTKIEQYLKEMKGKEEEAKTTEKSKIVQDLITTVKPYLTYVLTPIKQKLQEGQTRLTSKDMRNDIRNIEVAIMSLKNEDSALKLSSGDIKDIYALYKKLKREYGEKK